MTTLVEVGVGCDKIEVKILGFPLKKKGKKKQKNEFKKNIRELQQQALQENKAKKKKGKKKQKNKLKKNIRELQQQALQENKAKKAQLLHRSLHNGNRTMVVLRLSLPYLQQTE